MYLIDFGPSGKVRPAEIGPAEVGTPGMFILSVFGSGGDLVKLDRSDVIELAVSMLDLVGATPLEIELGRRTATETARLIAQSKEPKVCDCTQGTDPWDGFCNSCTHLHERGVQCGIPH